MGTLTAARHKIHAIGPTYFTVTAVLIAEEGRASVFGPALDFDSTIPQHYCCNGGIKIEREKTRSNLRWESIKFYVTSTWGGGVAVGFFRNATHQKVQIRNLA